METTVEEINEIVKWYRERPADFVGINDLKHKRQQLAGLSDWFATQLGKACEVMHEANAVYESEKMIKRNSYSDQKSDSYKDRKSRLNTLDEHKAAEKAKGVYWAMVYRLKSIGNVLEAMKQQLSILRKEYEEVEAMDAMGIRIAALNRQLLELEKSANNK